MEERGRRPGWRHRPGMTFSELLAAIGLLGVLGALLLPRLAPAIRRDVPLASQGTEDEAREPCCGTIRLDVDGGWICGEVDGPRLSLAERGVIGAQLHPRPTEDGYIRIARLIPGSPAEKAGVQSGDAILSIDGMSARNWGSEQVARMIRRGQPGTPVRLSFRREGARPVEATIVRRDFLSVYLPGFANW